jgi:hypothetical protein
MQTVLIILGVLGFGAVVISAYVFTVAARNYVSDKNHAANEPGEQERLFVVRTQPDRRTHQGVVDFPLTLPDGEVVEADRRVGERRSSA